MALSLARRSWAAGDRALVMAMFLTAATLMVCGVAISPLLL